MIWHKFKALGTDIIFFALLEPEQKGILEEAEKMVREFEKKFSRFIENNELADFNNSLKTDIVVSETMAELLKEASHYFIKTKGVFDPTIIGSLEKIGYDKNFIEIDTGTDDQDRTKINLDEIQSEFRLRPKMSDIEIREKMIRREAGLRIDFGGIGKGYIIDTISKVFFAQVKNYWLSAGGDIIATGDQNDGVGWDIGIQSPTEPEKNIFFINTRGEKLGIASSGVTERSGQKGGFKWNHIIDPRTGLPVNNDILSVTVISSSATKADIYAKTVLILGKNDGLDFIEKEGDSACMIIMKDKKLIFSRRASHYLKM